ncbi:MAG TPA: hypothetical protein VLF87_00740 [Patescibacteria group bacterium]|nr:hypothetical protein [Candidatus Saccharimonadales bacterium]HSX46504.1 hypothetical protein [Patescibacteria group bacterium]
MLRNKFQKAFAGYLVLILIYWIWLHLSGKTTTNFNFFYSFLFSLVPLIGGFVGILKSSIWGRLHSALGRSVFYFGLGLFLWGAGSMVWSYYNFVPKIAAPYPSIADIGFALSIVFWAIGAINLSRASGAKYGLRKPIMKVLVVTIPILVLAVSYYLLVTVARQGVLVPAGETPLKVFLDIAYPFGDVMSLTLATVILGLSFKFLGGVYRWSMVCILVGLAVMYFGDFIFSYTTTVGTFYNGDWGDLVLTAGLFFMTFGLMGFCSTPNTTRIKPVQPGVA